MFNWKRNAEGASLEKAKSLRLRVNLVLLKLTLTKSSFPVEKAQNSNLKRTLCEFDCILALRTGMLIHGRVKKFNPSVNEDHAIRLQRLLWQILTLCWILQDNTEVWIVWAWRRNDDANLGLNGNLKHTATGISTRKYNLFKEAQGSNVANGMGLPASTLATLTLVACALPLF